MINEQAKANGGINLKNWQTQRAQIIVTYDCNRDCPFCINYRLGQKRKGFVKVSDALYFLQYVKYVENIKEAIVVFLGGEPTLLPLETLKELSDLVHSMGYKTEFYTNGVIKEKLLELDGYIDFITISNYSKGLLPFENADWLYKFEKSTITISKLISKQSFKTFEDFDKFVDEANKLPFNYDFATMQEMTPDFDLYHPEWVEEKLLPRCESQSVGGNVGAVLYKDRLIKLPHKKFHIKEDICQFKLYPNGNVNTSWKNDDMEIDYKKAVNDLLRKNV